MTNLVKRTLGAAFLAAAALTTTGCAISPDGTIYPAPVYTGPVYGPVYQPRPVYRPAPVIIIRKDDRHDRHDHRDNRHDRHDRHDNRFDRHDRDDRHDRNDRHDRHDHRNDRKPPHRGR